MYVTFQICTTTERFAPCDTRLASETAVIDCERYCEAAQMRKGLDVVWAHKIYRKPDLLMCLSKMCCSELIANRAGRGRLGR